MLLPISLREYNIGILPGASGTESNGKVAMQQSSGRIADELARLFAKCYISLPIYLNDCTKDYVLQSDNVELVPQPVWGKIFQGLRHPIGILRAGKRLVDSSDIIYIRGTFPYLPLIHSYALFRGKPVIQWVAGDLLTSLKLEPEVATLKGKLRCVAAWFDEKWLRFIRKWTHVYMVTSGCALYEKYKSPRTTLAVSSTINEDEFYYREDTCEKDPVRILFVGFVRPPKGLRYLIESLGQLKTSRKIQLAVVGDTTQYSLERERIKRRIDELGLTDNVSWEGYAGFGPELFSQYRRSDIFVLPTLTEGAPHVLIEARAFGLPIISTWVGGIPSSVKDGKDGVLVPPKDSRALAEAIDRVIGDEEFRKRLILNGYETAKKFSLKNFISQLAEIAGKALKERIR